MRIKTVIAYVTSLILLMQSLISLLPVGEAFAATPPASGTYTKYINLATNSLDDTPPRKYLPKNSYDNMRIDLGPGNIKKAVVKVNGTEVTAPLNGNAVTFNATGKEHKVYAWTVSRPGHYVYKTNDPDKPSVKGLWHHRGGSPDLYEPYRTQIPNFDQYLQACHTVSPVVNCGDPILVDTGNEKAPGILPDAGLNQANNAYFGINHYPINLRYTFGRDPNDLKPNYDWNGAAVTAQYDVPAPNEMCKDLNEDPGDVCISTSIVNFSEIDQSSIKVTEKSRANAQNPDAEVYHWGKGRDGTGQVYVRRFLTDTEPDLRSFEQVDANTRNYYMTADVHWEAKTYEYVVTVDITYEPTFKPNFSNVSFADKCVEIGKATTFNWQFTNTGIDSLQPFKVSFRADNVEFDSLTITATQFSGSTQKGTFTYTLNTMKAITIFVDSGNNINEENEDDNSYTKAITPVSSCSGGGSSEGPEVITGTIDVTQPTVKYGDGSTTWFRDVNVSGGPSPGCTLVDGKVIYKQGVLTKIYEYDRSGDFYDTFVASPYNGFTVGTLTVQYDITTSCGTKKTIGPGTITVISNPGNSNPEFEASWFNEDDYANGYGTKIKQVPIGETVSLGPVVRPQTPTDHGTPYDPDGDFITYFWDFDNSTSEWIRGLGEWRDANSEHFSRIKADVRGTHTIQVTAFDGRGGFKGPIDVTLKVVDPPPIPVIDLPPKVIEGRPYTPAISCANSYSPYADRTIATCDWYGTVLPIYPSYGDYTIKLDVTDSAGLRSAETAYKVLTVLEDLPPIPKLTYTPVGVRGAPMQFTDASESPDGDPIAKHVVKLTCDMNNNGSYADDITQTMTLDSVGKFSYTPTHLGNCKINIYLQEGLGLKKTATKDFFFSVVNQAPEADFSAVGTQPQPPNITTVSIDGNTFVNSAAWSASSVTNASVNKNYSFESTENAIETIGMNTVAPYKSITGNNVTKSWTRIERNASIWGYTPSFVNSLRLDRRLWRSSSYFYNEDNPDIPRGNSFTATPYIGAEYQKKYFPEIYNFYDYELMGINAEANMIWMRKYPDTSTYNNTFQWTDYYFRVSDLKNFRSVPWLGNSTINPYWQGNQYKSYLSYRYAPDRSEYEPPPPSTWKSPSVTKEGNTMEVEEYRTRYGTPPYYTASKSTGIATFVKDYAGNLYKNRCDIYGDYFSTNERSYCVLDKYDPSGTERLWTSDPSFVPRSKKDKMYNANVSVEAISSANNAIIIKEESRYAELLKYQVRDNYSGAVILDFSSGYETGIQYLGVYGDTVAYVKRVYASGNGTQTLMFYNMTTGVTTDGGQIGTYAFKNVYGAPHYPDAKVAAEVSRDGKLILAVSLKNILVYNLKTMAKETEIDPQIGMDGARIVYDSSTVTRTVSEIHLTEDGRLKVLYEERTDGSSTYEKYWELTIQSDVDSTAESYNYGYLTGSNIIQNGDILYKLKFSGRTYSDTAAAGVGFRSQDHKNMYRLEATPDSVTLTKIVNGTRTVLGTSAYNFAVGTYYDFKVKLRGTHLTIYVNGLPLIDVYDNTFNLGKYGPYAEVPYMMMKNFTALTYDFVDVSVENVAIVNQPITYNAIFDDPDKDPEIKPLAKWTFTNTQPYKFLDAGDGASDPPGVNTYNNVVLTNPGPTLTKVGVYKVDYEIPDDPAPAGYRYPDNTFASFRKYSDPATHYITVHRVPISCFTLATNPDGTIAWDESCSYDPDRWLSVTNYSTEPTGIDYSLTHGIMDKRYMYTSPSGVTTPGKLTRPTETGAYTLRMAVKDEFGAWSDWYEQIINVTFVPANQPPTATLTFPNGTFDNPSYVTSLTPTLTWHQSDPDAGTIFAQARVSVRDATGKLIIDKTFEQNSDSPTGQWKIDTLLQEGQKYQVQVMVSDSAAWSPWSNIGWFITNRPPEAAMTFPSGASAASPTIVPTVRPTFTWSQTDPDPGTIFSYFEIQVRNEDNTVMVLTSGEHWQNTSSSSGSFAVDKDLPYGQLLRVRVRVYDGLAWSAWSPDKWFRINRAPIADFDWAPKPIWEGDAVHFTNLSSDPDGDSLSYVWDVVDPDNRTAAYTSWNAPPIQPALPGVYRVSLTVSDGIESATVLKNVSVTPLTLEAEVAHTPEWRSYHEQQGHETVTNPKDFYSGEIFVVQATSSPAPVDTVTAWIDTTAADGSHLLLSTTLTSIGEPNRYAGELFDEKLLLLTGGLPEGLQPVHFQIRYANGVVKNREIPVRIIGKVLETVGVHRIQ
ncbi:PKD domain-containing protein [Paenibacillus chartarius]|uniref:PKD domain-containing protein n=1 Tax=Paenibacillus chartarius TaxID=747481 RepID=A0ABV6DI31_9BACL